MSFRYGVELVPEPAFVACAHPIRKMICDQYGSWTAEMFMIHLTVADFFQCPEASVAAVDAGLAAIAAQSQKGEPEFLLSNHGVATFPDATGTVFLDFDSPEKPKALHTLHRRTIDLLKQTSGVSTDMQRPIEEYWPHLTLMQDNKISPGLFADVVEFAKDVVEYSQIPRETHAWRLLFVRFQSQAADADEEGWKNSLWAADLRWDLLASHPL